MAKTAASPAAPELTVVVRPAASATGAPLARDPRLGCAVALVVKPPAEVLAPDPCPREEFVPDPEPDTVPVVPPDPPALGNPPDVCVDGATTEGT